MSIVVDNYCGQISSITNMNKVMRIIYKENKLYNAKDILSKHNKHLLHLMTLCKHTIGALSHSAIVYTSYYHRVGN